MRVSETFFVEKSFEEHLINLKIALEAKNVKLTIDRRDVITTNAQW